MAVTRFELIEKEVAAFNARDMEAFLETFAEDATLEGLSGLSGPMAGHDAMRKHFGTRMSQPGLHVEILSRVALGTWVVDHEIVHNDAGSVEQLAIYELRDGLISHVQVIAPQ